MDDKIDKIDYEDKYEELRSKLEVLWAQRVELDILQEEETVIMQRVTTFRKIFESGKEVTEFNPDEFKTGRRTLQLTRLRHHSFKDEIVVSRRDRCHSI